MCPDHDRAGLGARDPTDDVAVRALNPDASRAGLAQATSEECDLAPIGGRGRGARAKAHLGAKVSHRAPLVEAPDGARILGRAIAATGGENRGRNEPEQAEYQALSLSHDEL
jgi:hypothetical protein